MWAISVLVVLLLAMGVVAFLTLLERKVLGLTQCRLGPNKVGLFGVLQPVFDGVKLLSKDSFRPTSSQSQLFFVSPVFLMFLFFLMWEMVIPWMGNTFLVKSSSLVFFCCLALMAYSVIMTGWSSTSAFSKMGSLRGILQSLSYEVALILVIIWCVSFYSSFSITSFAPLNLEMMLTWLTSVFTLSLMEGNRAPFDLLEGESELISGFNIEMGSLMFVYLFLSEYGMIALMSAIILILLSSEMWLALFVLLSSLMLMMRSCFPRIRYDSLMGLMWKGVLPVSVFLTSLVVMLK